jgi:hypothetical protein
MQPPFAIPKIKSGKQGRFLLLPGSCQREPAGFDLVINQTTAARRAVSGERHASGLTIPMARQAWPKTNVRPIRGKNPQSRGPASSSIGASARAPASDSCGAREDL